MTDGLWFALTVLGTFGGGAVVHLMEHAAVAERDHDIAVLAARLNRERQRAAKLERELAGRRIEMLVEAVRG